MEAWYRSKSASSRYVIACGFLIERREFIVVLQRSLESRISTYVFSKRFAFRCFEIDASLDFRGWDIKYAFNRQANWSKLRPRYWAEYARLPHSSQVHTSKHEVWVIFSPPYGANKGFQIWVVNQLHAYLFSCFNEVGIVFSVPQSGLCQLK